MGSEAGRGGRGSWTLRERELIHRLDTPERVQRWLRSLPYNYERRRETLRTFRVVARLGTAHCLEAALTAATIMEAHGYPPLLLDMESIDDLDHVVFLFRRGGRWGTVAKSRDPGLFGRKPVFRSPRDLVWSYFDPYIDMTGRINGYGVFDLRALRKVDWRRSERDVWAVQDALIGMPHRPLPSSDVRYGLWHRRYVEFRRRFPDTKPVYYGGRERWL
ncbi:MAG: hypothetical protein A3K65_00365 [Euryarchaeota archaeon RBG_16_68_12]|nr:MAG: hypothetical protein A3K65_00365 [Euryarchaeota archaeon RBG_16_68_12]